jgi:hypothetical protein
MITVMKEVKIEAIAITDLKAEYASYTIKRVYQKRFIYKNS